MPTLTPERPARDGERREYYTVTISSTTGSGVTQFRVPKPWLKVVVGTLAVLGVGILVGLAAFGHLLSQAQSTSALKQENADLRRQMTQLTQIERRLAALDSSRVAMLRVVGVESPEPAGSGAAGQEPDGADAGSGYFAAAPGPEPGLEDLETIRAVLTHEPLAGPHTRGFGLLLESNIFHTGNDIAGRTGASVAAAGEGVVTFVGSDPVFGNVLVIGHGPRLATMYGHASRVLVRVGDYVTAGQVVAVVGSTGRSSAPHLHFEVQWDGRAVDPGRALAAWEAAGGPAGAGRVPESAQDGGERTTDYLGSR